ncbi:type-IV secretion system protein TraC [Pandoraea aquatica]|uniref:Type-IV secretion system protein TraC n=1 Tax=Pandoraea aquatica TaxID=2508290 RepID=A0A5E4Z5R0_9BURK|nr:type-IV secretion system protein TraC [Pandoraea aquatica]
MSRQGTSRNTFPETATVNLIAKMVKGQQFKCPISDVINLETYTNDSNLVVSKADSEKAYVGAVYRMSPLSGGGGEFSTVIQNAFKSVPDDSVIQVSLIVQPDHEAPETFAQGKEQGGEVVQHLIGRQKKLFTDALVTGSLSDMPILNCRTVIISLAIPNRKVDDNTLEESEHLQNEFLANIRDVGFQDVKRLSARELVGVYRWFSRIYEPNVDAALDPLMELKYQIFGPDETFSFIDTRYGVFNDDTHCTAVTVKSYPEQPFHGIMNLVSGAPFNKGPTREGGGQRLDTPYILTTTVRVANQRKEWDRVESAIKSRSVVQNIPIKLGVEDPAAKLKDLLALKKQAGEDGNKFVHVSTNVFLFGRAREEVVRAAATVKGTLDKLGFDSRQVTGTGLVRWAQALPLNFSSGVANKIAGEAITTASEVGCLLPVYGDYLGNANRTFTNAGAAYMTRRGSALYFDPFISNSNYCGVMAAKSGAGKSFNLQYQILCDLAAGRTVMLFDNGRSSKKFCASVGGEFNEFGGRSGFRPSLQPFTGLSDDEFDEQQETITALLVMMAYDNEPQDPGARIATNEAVKAAWGKRSNRAEISDVIDCLVNIVEQTREDKMVTQVATAANNLIPRLRAFIQSPTRGPYFTGPSTIDPRKQFTVFELAGLGDDDHLKRCVLFCCINVLMTRIKTLPGQKRIWVDESLDLIKVESAAAAMEGLYLKGRKEKVAVWMIIQSLLKLSEFPAGSVILRQSAWKVIMAQESEEIDAVVEQKVMTAFANDPYFNRLLRSVESKKGLWSEMLIMGEETYEVCRLYVDKFTGALFSSEGDAKDAVFELMEQGMNVLDAVAQVMGDTRDRRARWMQEFIQVFTGREGMSRKEVINELKELLSEKSH